MCLLVCLLVATYHYPKLNLYHSYTIPLLNSNTTLAVTVGLFTVRDCGACELLSSPTFHWSHAWVATSWCVSHRIYRCDHWYQSRCILPWTHILAGKETAHRQYRDTLSACETYYYCFSESSFLGRMDGAPCLKYALAQACPYCPCIWPFYWASQQTHTTNANHKNCKAGEVVAVTNHNTVIYFCCLTTLCSPLYVTQNNRISYKTQCNTA